MMTMPDILEQFKDLGISASFHFADDSGKEWNIAHREQGIALALYRDNPALQDDMRKIAKGFLWSLSLALEDKS